MRKNMYIDSRNMEVLDFGRMSYGRCLELQHAYFDSMVYARKHNKDVRERLILVEHNPVVTLGRHAQDSNLLLSEESLRGRGIDCFRVGRGGDVTYHGPGQLVAYPLLNLDSHGLGVKDYVKLLEETVIRTIGIYGIIGERVEGATGVWIGKGGSRERKISAIGVRCSRFCTMHGVALNVNVDLSGFTVINPCGFTDKGVTSMSAELGQSLDFREVKKLFSDIFLRLVFSFKKGFYLFE